MILEDALMSLCCSPTTVASPKQGLFSQGGFNPGLVTPPPKGAEARRQPDGSPDLHLSHWLLLWRQLSRPLSFTPHCVTGGFGRSARGRVVGGGGPHFRHLRSCRREVIKARFVLASRWV